MFASVLFRRVLPQINIQKSAHAYPKDFPLTTKFSRDSKVWKPVNLPKPGVGKAFRRIVHFKDEYTIEPLNVTNLAGRDPNTGRVVAKGIGGGIKHKFHQIQWIRDGPTEDPPKEEKVLEIFQDGCRTGFVALVGSGDVLNYYLATENMKVGDIIKTSRYIPRKTVRANEGDAYPLGALPVGTVVHNIEMHPGKGSALLHAAGAKGTIMKKDEMNRVIVKMPGKRPKDFSFDPNCLATVGQVSNSIHSSIPIGSAQRNRELGNRPRSGLWKRKDGRYGRKIKKPPPVKHIRPLDAPSIRKIQLSLSQF